MKETRKRKLLLLILVTSALVVSLFVFCKISRRNWLTERFWCKYQRIYFSYIIFNVWPWRGKTSDRTGSNVFKLKKGRFRLGIRKKFSTMRVVRHWHRLPREAVDAPSLEVLKARLDRALGSLVWWKVSLPMAYERKINCYDKITPSVL